MRCAAAPARNASRPLQIVLGGTDYAELARWRDIVIEEAGKIPGLSNLQSDYNERKPKIDVAIDRDRAADQLVAGQLQVDVLEVVGAGAADADGVHGSARREGNGVLYSAAPSMGKIVHARAGKSRPLGGLRIFRVGRGGNAGR